MAEQEGVPLQPLSPPSQPETNENIPNTNINNDENKGNLQENKPENNLENKENANQARGSTNLTPSLKAPSSANQARRNSGTQKVPKVFSFVFFI